MWHESTTQQSSPTASPPNDPSRLLDSLAQAQDILHDIASTAKMQDSDHDKRASDEGYKGECPSISYGSQTAAPDEELSPDRNNSRCLHEERVLPRLLRFATHCGRQICTLYECTALPNFLSSSDDNAATDVHVERSGR